MLRRTISASILVAAGFVLSDRPTSGWSETPPIHRDGAPPGYTGGFGEETCRHCHFDNDLNDPEGRLQLTGVPDSYTPDSLYEIVVSLTRARMARAGFSLSARFPDGQPAGTWAVLDTLVQLSAGKSGVPFPTHTESGNQVVDEAASWRVEWLAPADSGLMVIFNLAANAANGDDSEFGDYVYALEHTAQGVAKARGDE